MKVKYKINGKTVSLREFRKHPKIGGKGVAMTTHTTYQAHKPLVSEGLGVLPHQVAEARKVYQEAGLSAVHVCDNGAVEFTSRGNRGRRGLLKLRHKIDLDGGYGDG